MFALRAMWVTGASALRLGRAAGGPLLTRKNSIIFLRESVYAPLGFTVDNRLATEAAVSLLESES